MRKIFLSIGLIGLTACTTLQAPDPDLNNEAIVKQIYVDFAAGNMEGFTAALAPDIVWIEADNNPYLTESPYLGVDAVVSGVLAPLGKNWTTFSVLPEHYLVDGDTVAMFGRYDATNKATGKTMTPQIVHVWTLADGKLTGFQQYGDTAAMAEAITQGGAAYTQKIGKQLLHDYLAAINTNDPDRIVAMLSDDVVLQAPHGPEVVGKAAARAWLTGYVGAFASVWQKTALDFTLSGDWAFEHYAYTSAETNRKTGLVTRDKGKGLIIYHRGADGKWRVSRDAWSTDLPLPQ